MKEIVDFSSRICLTLPLKKKGTRPNFSLSPQEERGGGGAGQVQDRHDVPQQPAAGRHPAEGEPVAAAGGLAGEQPPVTAGQGLGGTRPRRHLWVTFPPSLWVCCVLSPSVHR